MSKHFIVFVAKDDNFMYTDVDSLTAAGIGYEYVADNKLPLAKAYNDAIARHSDVDYLYLVHADVKTDFTGLAAQIDELAGIYDVLGLCGCSKISVSQSPLNWFCGSIPFPEHRWGCVTHGELKNQVSFFSAHSPDQTHHEVACIDGLCIVMSKHAIDSGLRFDENLGQYDMYDTDISFQAVLKYGLKLGVVVRRDLQHYSVGRSILSENFLRTEIKFRAKWNLDIPENSPIKKLPPVNS